MIFNELDNHQTCRCPWAISTPSNTWLLGHTRVDPPNGILNS